MNKKILVLIDLLLRFSSLGGKFLLLVFVAKELGASVVGEYGLITGLVGMVLYVVGMDFYTYSTREVLHQQIGIWEALYNQFVFYLINYFVIFLIWAWLADFSGVKEHIWLVFCLLICEHLSQELYRFLIISKRITIANIQNFIRNGLWCYFCLVLSLLGNLNLNIILISWLTCSFFSVIYVFLFIFKLNPPKKQDFNLNFKWIKKGVSVALVFFVGTLFLRCIFYFDKIIINYYSNATVVGVYVFYVGIINAVQSGLDVIVVSRYYPSLVASIDDRKELIKNKKIMLSKIRVFTGLLYALSIPSCWVIIEILGKEEYKQTFYIYPLMCIAWGVFNISYVNHYILFGLKQDVYILKCNVISTFTFFICILIIYQLMNNILLSVVISFVISYLLQFFLKKYKVAQLFSSLM